MNICINCLNECGNYICESCADNANMEELCEKLCEYSYAPERGEPWDKLAETLTKPRNLKNLVFPLSKKLSKDKKIFYRIFCIGQNYSSFPKISREWLWKNAHFCLKSSGLTERQKNRIKGYLFDSYYKDYRYDEAEEIANEFSDSSELTPQNISALGDYYIKTRRYEGAEEILENGIKQFPEHGAEYEKLLEESAKRQLGKENGGLPEYLPNPRENRDEVRQKYIDFLASVGIDYEAPVKAEKKSVKKLSSVPDMPELRKAGFKDFVAYDVETTGLNAKFDSIIEIGAARVRGGEITDTFQMFVKPYKAAVKPFITELTGITKEMVMNAPQMWEAFDSFAEFFGDDILIGYNSVNFDNRFLTRAGKYAGKTVDNSCFDVMRYAKGIKEKIGYTEDKMSLGMISDFLHIENPQAHRALADAETTAKVYLKLLELDMGEESGSLDDILSDFDNL